MICYFNKIDLIKFLTFPDCDVTNASKTWGKEGRNCVGVYRTKIPVMKSVGVFEQYQNDSHEITINCFQVRKIKETFN